MAVVQVLVRCPDGRTLVAPSALSADLATVLRGLASRTPLACDQHFCLCTPSGRPLPLDRTLGDLGLGELSTLVLKPRAGGGLLGGVVDLSGTYSGAWYQGGSTGPFQLTIEGDSSTGIRGEGADSIGRFTVRGKYNESSEQVSFVKAYIGKHSLNYEGRGTPDGFRGRWVIVGSCEGTWDMRRVSVPQHVIDRQREEQAKKRREEEEERRRQEEERRRREEAQRKAQQEEEARRRREEEERRAEEQRRAEEERKKVEAQRQAEELRARSAAPRPMSSRLPSASSTYVCAIEFEGSKYRLQVAAGTLQQVLDAVCEKVGASTADCKVEIHDPDLDDYFVLDSMQMLHEKNRIKVIRTARRDSREADDMPALPPPPQVVHRGTQQRAGASRRLGAPVEEQLSLRDYLRFPPGYSPSQSCEQSLRANAAELSLSNVETMIASVNCFINEELKFSDPPEMKLLDQSELFAIVAYTFDFGDSQPEDNLYHKLNNDLRQRMKAKMECWWGYLYYLMNGLKKLPDVDEVLYRGIPADKAKMLEKEYAMGRRIRWTAFSSTTNNLEVAKNFAGPGGVIFRIKGNSGRNIQSISFIKGENELLLNPNITFRVKRTLSEWYLTLNEPSEMPSPSPDTVQRRKRQREESDCDDELDSEHPRSRRRAEHSGAGCAWTEHFTTQPTEGQLSDESLWWMPQPSSSAPPRVPEREPSGEVRFERPHWRRVLLAKWQLEQKAQEMPGEKQDVHKAEFQEEEEEEEEEEEQQQQQKQEREWELPAEEMGAAVWEDNGDAREEEARVEAAWPVEDAIQFFEAGCSGP
eukprot:m51a1_g8319 hypothetical protein (810) ;mRNA; f:119496-123757